MLKISHRAAGARIRTPFLLPPSLFPSKSRGSIYRDYRFLKYSNTVLLTGKGTLMRFDAYKANMGESISYFYYTYTSHRGYT
jgi:hypothetical protein